MTAAFGFDVARAAELAIGTRVRGLLEARGIASVATGGFQAPCVIVSYTERSDFQTTQAFAKYELQVAAGVLLACYDGPDFRTLRLSLFGLDKPKNTDRTVASSSARWTRHWRSCTIARCRFFRRPTQRLDLECVGCYRSVDTVAVWVAELEDKTQPQAVLEETA